MPKIPGAGDLPYTSNTFFLAESSAFDIDCITPNAGDAPITLREYFDMDDTYNIIPTGNSGYEYVSLYPLFARSQMDVLGTIITAEAKPVKGHPNTKWDYTSTEQAIWIVDESQLQEILYENTIMQEFQDISFTVKYISSTDEIYGLMLSDTKCDMVAVENAEASDLSAEGMLVSRLIVEGVDSPAAVRLRFVSPSIYVGCRTAQKFNQVKIQVDGVKYRLYLDGEAGGDQPQYIRGLTTALHDYFVANVDLEITIGILGRYGK